MHTLPNSETQMNTALCSISGESMQFMTKPIVRVRNTILSVTQWIIPDLYIEPEA